MLISEARLLEIIEEEYVNILLEEVQAMGMPDHVKDLLQKRNQAHDYAVRLATEFRNDPELKAYLPPGYSLKSSYYEKSPLAKRLEKVPILNKMANLISKGKMKTKEDFIPDLGLVSLISSKIVDLAHTFALEFNPADKNYKQNIKNSLIKHFKDEEAISKEKQASPQRSAAGEFPAVDKTVVDPSSQPTTAEKPENLPDYEPSGEKTANIRMPSAPPAPVAKKPDSKPKPAEKPAAAAVASKLPPSIRAGIVNPRARMPSAPKVTAKPPSGDIDFSDLENREKYPAEYAAYKAKRAGGIKSENKKLNKIKVKVRK